MSNIDLLYKDQKLLRYIVENLFTFRDLDDKFEQLNETTGGIFCPFHDNAKSPAATMYYDYESDIEIIHCFTEHKRFTSYDYLMQVMDVGDPIKYILKQKEANLISEMIDAFLKGTNIQSEKLLDKKLAYINQVFDDSNEDMEEFIERLYTDGLH